MLEIIKDKSDNLEVLIIKFGAKWCASCVVLDKVLDEMKESSESFKDMLVTIDVDVDSDIATSFKVRSLPTMLFLKKGEVVDKMVGTQTKENILNKISSIKD